MIVIIEQIWLDDGLRLSSGSMCVVMNHLNDKPCLRRTQLLSSPILTSVSLNFSTFTVFFERHFHRL